MTTFCGVSTKETRSNYICNDMQKMQIHRFSRTRLRSRCVNNILLNPRPILINENQRID